MPAIVVAGVCMEPDTIEPMFGIVKELEPAVRAGLHAGGVRPLRSACWPTGKVDAEALITAKVGLDGVKGAFDGLGQSGTTHEDFGRAVALMMRWAA